MDVHSSQTAKLVFANPFCSNPLLKMDVTVAFTDLAGKILQTGSGDATSPAKKRRSVILSCNDSVQIEISRYQITGNSNTVVGVLQIIPDLNGIPWVPVNVPLASVQVGTGNGRGFQPSIVLIPLEPVRRLILP